MIESYVTWTKTENMVVSHDCFIQYFEYMPSILEILDFTIIISFYLFRKHGECYGTTLYCRYQRCERFIQTVMNLQLVRML